MKKYIKSIVVLFSICAVVAIMMAMTNYITAPIIEAKEAEATQKSLLEVMPSGENFEMLDISAYALPSVITEVYRETNGGYVFKLDTKGHSAGLVIMCGVNADGTISGAQCLSSGETFGYEKTFGENFKDKALADVEKVDTISGATKTTKAYKEAIKAALEAAEILKGGETDEK